MTDPLQDLADMARSYYEALRQRGISEPLALEFAKQWHLMILTAAVGDERNRAIEIAQRVTRGAVKVGGRS